MRKNEKKANKVKKEKKVLSADVFVMYLIFGAIILVLVGVVTFKFGELAGVKNYVRGEEDRINKVILGQKELEDKYQSDFSLVVTKEHESEKEFDETIYKKDYPLITHGYESGDQWQVVISLDRDNPDGTTLVCADTELLNKYCDSLYTFVPPFKNQVQTKNAIYVFNNGIPESMIYCERVYFASQELRDGFEEIKNSELTNYMQ
ncbi:MAG: hypothetical protein PHE51_01115 [Eubacteriales bacterium]|nr:hypothetical protein [Eubacteriales bacterium]